MIKSISHTGLFLVNVKQTVVTQVIVPANDAYEARDRAIERTYEAEATVWESRDDERTFGEPIELTRAQVVQLGLVPHLLDLESQIEQLRNASWQNDQGSEAKP